jgi:hypothetical protein
MFVIRPGEVGFICRNIAEDEDIQLLSACAIYVEAILSNIWPGASALRQKAITAFSQAAAAILNSDDLNQTFDGRAQ